MDYEKELLDIFGQMIINKVRDQTSVEFEAMIQETRLYIHTDKNRMIQMDVKIGDYE